jgi:TorA maturation chaperone TorD
MAETQADQTVDTAPDIAAARARSGFYRLLARILCAEPEVALLDELSRPPLRDALDEAGVDVTAILSGTAKTEMAQVLAEEYTRLFLGPGRHISPHESVQLKRGSGALWGPETGVVKRFIEEAGFDYDEAYHGLPDHISVELEFLAHLADQEADAIEAKDEVKLCAAISWQHRFISQHLGKWAANFAREVKAQADLPFYPAFTGLLPRYLATEKSALGKFLHGRGLLGSVSKS